MRQRHVQHLSTVNLSVIAERIVNHNALPVRTDFLPMKSWHLNRMPSKKFQEQFAIQVNQSMRMHAQSVMSDGYYAFQDIEHQLIAYFELAILVKTFEMGNCDAFCGYVLDYLFENNLNIPFTMLALNNYRHVCVVLGVNIGEEEYMRRGVHFITDDIYKNAIILDLWNTKSPLQRPDQFQSAMRELFDRESGFCINLSSPSTTHELAVRCLFHLPKPQVYREFYQRNFPILQDLKRFYEERIGSIRERTTFPPQSFFQPPLSRHETSEEDPDCCSMLVKSVMKLVRSS